MSLIKMRDKKCEIKNANGLWNNLWKIRCRKLEWPLLVPLPSIRESTGTSLIKLLLHGRLDINHQ